MDVARRGASYATSSVVLSRESIPDGTRISSYAAEKWYAERLSKAAAEKWRVYAGVQALGAAEDASQFRGPPLAWHCARLARLVLTVMQPAQQR